MLGVEFALLLALVVLILALVNGYAVGLSLGGGGILTLVLVWAFGKVGVFDPALVPELDRAATRSLGALPARLSDGLLGGGVAAIFLAIPLFVLMGALLQVSGVATRIFEAGERLIGRLLSRRRASRRGSAHSHSHSHSHSHVGLVVVVVAALLAATTGVVGASVSALALVAYPSLVQRGYSPGQASGLVIASGTLGQAVPPSIVLVLLSVGVNEYYALEHPGQAVDVKTLFVVALAPSGLLVLAYGLYAAFWLDRKALPPQGTNEPGEVRADASLAGLGSDLWAFLAPVVLIVVVLGSIVAGFATLGQAAGLGALGALGMALMMGRMTWARLWQAFWNSAQTWANIGLILIGALVFNLSLKGFGGDLYLQSLVAQVDQPLVLLFVVLLAFFILGFFLEFVELLALLLPVFGPLLFASDLNPYWIAILVAMTVNISFLTPPMGLSIFYFQAALRDQHQPAEAGLCGSQKRLAHHQRHRQPLPRPQPRPQDIYSGLVPFILIQLALLVLWFAVPLVIGV